MAQLTLQDRITASTGTIDVTVPANVKAFFIPTGPVKTFAAWGTSNGTWSATVNIYQVINSSAKVLLCTLSIANSKTIDSLDVQTPAAVLVAEVAFTGSPSDGVSVAAEG